MKLALHADDIKLRIGVSGGVLGHVMKASLDVMVHAFQAGPKLRSNCGRWHIEYG